MSSEELAARFARVSRELVTAGRLQPTLDRLVDLATATVDGCDHAGITLAFDRQLHTAAATHEVVEEVDELQVSLDEGPCLDAMADRRVCGIGDLSLDSRWPRWSPEAVARGIRGVLSFRLFLGDETLGALNLYAAEADAFDPVDADFGIVFASHAAVAIGCSRVAEQGAEELVELRGALRSRELIGQAKGVLMERHRLTSEQAFDRLREASQRRNRKLREVAEHLVHSGELDVG